MKQERNTAGWTVAMAALGINLILGILYSWGVIQRALVSQWGWASTEASLPYTVCVATFALMMIFAGRAQDVYGPRRVALIGGLLFGAGLLASSLTVNPYVMMVTFGVAGGMGIGFCYSAVTPCAIKWFEPRRKGLIAGIVVAGVGLSPVYISPITNVLLKSYTLSQTFLFLGILALAGITLLSLLLRNPPPGHVPASPSPMPAAVPAKGVDRTWRQIIVTRPFILLWLCYLMSGAAGLMLIAHLPSIAGTQVGWESGFLLVVILSVFNALGRISGGLLSDKAGRANALLIVFLIQAVNMSCFVLYQNIPLLMVGSAVAGLAYGALFALFPAATADFFGMRNLGVNYGLVFSGWGVAGIIGPIIGGLVVDKTGHYTLSYIISALMLLVGAVLVKQVKPPEGRS